MTRSGGARCSTFTWNCVLPSLVILVFTSPLAPGVRVEPASGTFCWFHRRGAATEAGQRQAGRDRHHGQQSASK